MSKILPPVASVRLPVSKSIGARFLTGAYFGGVLDNVGKFADCDDLKVIQRALCLLNSCRNGEGPCLEGSDVPEIDVRASGTAFRFMAAAIASTPGAEFVLTGTPRLCGRPMSPLLDVLRAAGAEIEALGKKGAGPYRISGKKLKGGVFSIRGDVSSQFVSALMLVAPAWEGGMSLRFSTGLVSRPYVEMTCRVMERFGIKANLSEHSVEVGEGVYAPPSDYTVEADWSAAGFFYEAASLLRREVMIEGLLPPGESLQGDSATAAVFSNLGVETEFSEKGALLRQTGKLPGKLALNMEDTPDLVPALVVACVLNGVEFRFEGVKNLRVKESDRLAAIKENMSVLGFVLKVEDDAISWDGSVADPLGKCVVHPYDDHRIAMAFAMAPLKSGRVKIEDPHVVGKSFASFWDELWKVRLNAFMDKDWRMNVRRRRKVEL